MITGLKEALSFYSSVASDHSAAQRAIELIKVLNAQPELAVSEISKEFNTPKTMVTDAYHSEKAQKAAAEVEKARKRLGNYYAKIRMEAKNKELTKKSSATSALSRLGRLFKRYV